MGGTLSSSKVVQGMVFGKESEGQSHLSLLVDCIEP